MKFSVTKEKFLEGLQQVQNVVSTRTTLPILSNVLLHAKGNEVHLTTTDLDVGVRGSFEAKVDKEGATTLPARRLFTIIRELPSSEVQIEVDGKNAASIRSGQSFFKILGLPEEEFPPLPKFEGAKVITIKQKELRDGLRKTSYHLFRHAIVGEAAYAALTEGDRALGHRLAGQWLQRQSAGAPAEIARHFDRAGDRTQAGPWYVRAAELALQASDLDQALALAEQAAQCGLRPDDLGTIKIVEARTRFWRAEYLEAELAAKRALRAGRPGSAIWYRAVGELAQSLGERGEYAELERQVRKAEAQAPEAGAALDRVGALLAGIGYLAVSSRRAAARSLLDELTGDFDDAIAARFHSCRAVLAAAEGQTFTASEELEIALVSYQRLGNPRRCCETTADLGSTAVELGDSERGIELLRGVVGEATRLGTARIATAAQVNLIQALAWAGQRAEAVALAGGALDSAREQGNRRLEAGAMAFLAEVALLGDELEEGERQARRALARAEGVEALRPAILAVLAWALLRRGELETARAQAQEAVVLFEREGRPEINEWMLAWVHVESLRANGDAGATPALGAAVARLEARAANIADRGMREKFLSLPHPARLLALSRPSIVTGR